ncbi:MAG: ArsR family transcriptional regulator [Rikenellaceae bacterium]
MVKFFINSNTTAYLRNLSTEFGESTNAIRQELNRFEKAKLLESKIEQNKKVYQANTKHPYFKDMHHLLLKYVGIEEIVDSVVRQIGELEKGYIINDFAQGNPGNVLDLLFVGNNFDYNYLNTLVRKAEESVSFKIRYIAVTPDEAAQYIPDKTKTLLVWSAGDNF